MSLRTKSLLMISATLLIMIAASYLAAMTIFQRGFRELEESQMRRELENVFRVLAEAQVNLQRVAQDYASRETIHAFFQNRNPAIIAADFTPEAYLRDQLNLVMLVVTSDGEVSRKLIYGNEFDFARQEVKTLHENLLDYLPENATLLDQVDAEKIELRKPPQLATLPAGPVLLAATSIYFASEKGAPQGILIVGRYLDSEIEKISRQTGLYILRAGWEIEEPRIPADFAIARQRLSAMTGGANNQQGGTSPASLATFIQPLGDQSIAGYMVLNDLQGKPTYLLRVDSPREIYQQGQASLRYLIIALAVGGLGFILVFTLLLERAILAPLAQMSTAIRTISSTGEYDERLPVSGKDELSSLAGSINRMLLEVLEQRTNDLNKRLLQIRTAAEVAQITTSGGTGPLTNKSLHSGALSLKDLLKQAIDLIVERFGYSSASIFLVDNNKEFAVLVETTAGGQNIKKDTLKIPVGSRTMVGWAAAKNQTRIAAEVSQDPYYIKDEFLPDTRSEAVIPLSVRSTTGDTVLGVLDIHSRKPNAFPPGDISVLQTLANQLATAIHNVRLLESTHFSLEEASLLYQASRNIAQAENEEDILQALDRALKQSPYLSTVFSVYPAGLKKISCAQIARGPASKAEITPLWDRLPITAKEIETFLRPGQSQVPFLVIDMSSTPTLPLPLLQLMHQWECAMAALIPVFSDDHLAALFMLGSRQPGAFTPTSLQPYASLAEVTATALQKVQALHKIEKSLAELRTLNAVSQAISIQTDLKSIYQEVHDAVRGLMGEVDFLIALYDPENNTIHIPYMWEKGDFLYVEPFPLGEGLTSLLIRSRQPLLIVENTEQRARELGAKVVGKPAKSWLGVPMIVGGEVMGAIIVQDVERERRFTEEDQRLLAILAGQVAATIRNIYILEKTRQQARREQILRQVTGKIRSSVDMQTILATAATELGKAIGARRVHIQAGIAKQPGVSAQLDADDGDGS